jgi:voltage-gated potassium channel Kch
MLPRVEYSVTARATPAALWEAFCDLGRLLGRGIYTEAIWIEGKPWQVGSRLRYVVVQPVAATVSAVVTLFEPPSKVGLLNHALGVTAQQLVIFTPLDRNNTRVAMAMDPVGEPSSLTPQQISSALEFFTKDALDTMLTRCRETHSPH